ncbi:putative receptor-like protein kinase [Canna indica]|uniref:Receptor-like protein kinase n=2 Tax=Magnoliopsida TaxID=3398 RepID=A0AAQ3L3F9_9LILI|nr:putative receptor-like protein kinase [Canna indica]
MSGFSSPPLLNDELSQRTAVFGLHMWVVVGICVGAAFVLLLFLISLWLAAKRGPAPPATARPTSIPSVSKEIQEIRVDTSSRSSAARPLGEILQKSLADSDSPSSVSIERQALLAPATQEDSGGYQRIHIEIGKGHRITYPERGGGDGRSAGHASIPVPEVSHLGWGHWYTLRELEVGTNMFAYENVIGEGGYGIVYHGVLQDQTHVAVKNLLNNRGQAEREFKVEVEAIGRVRHKNLVRLLGYCVEGAHRILVYEYVDNGNLDQWLHGDVGLCSPLTWEIRMNIILGTAKGYVAPEYASTGMLNERSDVYSFGILIMEIISGTRTAQTFRDSPQEKTKLLEIVESGDNGGYENTANVDVSIDKWKSTYYYSILKDCPLDFSWTNFTLASAACSDQNEWGKCCRYVNAFVAISVAHFASATGRLGVPPAFAEICINSISETFNLHGIPTSSTTFCGLGEKIRVSYQCQGRATVLEMMQIPNFADVIETCKVYPLLDTSCKRCLNSGIIYLHHLVGTDDNVTLSVCHNAVFVTLVNQGGGSSAVDMATCFFGIQGFNIFPGPSSQSLTPVTTPSSLTAEAPRQQITIPINKIHHNYHLSLVPGIGVGVIGLTVLLLLILTLLIRKKLSELHNSDASLDNLKNASSSTQFLMSEEGPSSMFRRFTYMEIKQATENFNTVIGKGGFRTVYKAQFADGSLAAVKLMNEISKQGKEDFCREMELLARLHHRHLVALKGFCIERDERLLVYEYMDNGSLKDHLHSSGGHKLSWRSRLQIAIDVANALEYLHFYCNPPLCHRDIKSSNILLDENFVAKVADFGFAHASRTGAACFEPVNTDIRGTPGYIDPEYLVTQELTEKSDIYSYGVLLLELVTGRKAIQDNRNLVEWFQKFMATDSRLSEVVDPVIRESFDFEQLHMVIGIIQWCTHREGQARPSIKQVLRVFSGHLDPAQNGFSGNKCNDGYAREME